MLVSSHDMAHTIIIAGLAFLCPPSNTKFFKSWPFSPAIQTPFHTEKDKIEDADPRCHQGNKARGLEQVTCTCLVYQIWMWQQDCFLCPLRFPALGLWILFVFMLLPWPITTYIWFLLAIHAGRNKLKANYGRYWFEHNPRVDGERCFKKDSADIWWSSEEIWG